MQGSTQITRHRFPQRSVIVRRTACSRLSLPGSQSKSRVASAHGILRLIRLTRRAGSAKSPSRRITTRLVFGNVDFQLDLGIDGDDEQFLCRRSQIVFATRIGNLLPPVDDVSTTLDAAAQITHDTNPRKAARIWG